MISISEYLSFIIKVHAKRDLGTKNTIVQLIEHAEIFGEGEVAVKLRFLAPSGDTAKR